MRIIAASVASPVPSISPLIPIPAFTHPCLLWVFQKLFSDYFLFVLFVLGFVVRLSKEI